MSRDMNVTIWPLWDNGFGEMYADVGKRWPENVDFMVYAKRLTDTELAAEYHSQGSQCRHEQWIEAVRGDDDYTDSERAGQSRMYDRLNALHRFATLPHHDDQP